MSNSKNYYVYRSDENELNRLQEEYESTGRYTRREPGVLVVLALPPQKVKEKKGRR